MIKRYAVQAFTLIELAIVLVIIGLLAGGVLTGQTMIHSSQVQSFASELFNYSTAIHTFQAKYDALPGDMNNATQFWGSPTGATSILATDFACTNSLTAASPAVCNGNGDNIIDVAGPNQDYAERYLAWKELANAGLITGTYSGYYVQNSNIWDIPGSNVPVSKYPSAVITFGPLGAVNAFFLKSSQSTFYEFPPQDVQNIDLKLDDGAPLSGKVLVNPTYTSVGSKSCLVAPTCLPTPTLNCLNSAVPSTVTYNGGDKNADCTFSYEVQ